MQSIDLHGKSIEDGLVAAEAFVDSNFTHKFQEVEIITGSGPMFHRIIKAMRSNPLVKEIKNDGILGFAYKGRIVLELEAH